MANLTTDLTTLTPITTTATALSNLILVSPQATVGYQPQNTVTSSGVINAQPPSILFHYEGEQTAMIESDITDHYIEDNTAIQDQVSLKPEIITTHGFIGELNDITPSVLAPLQTVANKLVTISAYTPSLSTTAIIAYDEAFQLYQVTENAAIAAVSTAASIGGALGITSAQGESVISSNGFTTQTTQFLQSNQQKCFQNFYGYWRNRVLFTVQTPWAIFQNMAILRLRAIQGAETNVITDFEVTFKMIRTASSQTLTQQEATIAQGRLVAQSSPDTDLGTITPTQVAGTQIP